VIGIRPELLRSLATDSGRDPRYLEIRSRFQARDAQIEHIGWALKTEMENGYPCGRIYLDSLAMALAARVVGSHSSLSRLPNGHNGRMSNGKLREVLSFIEDNLSQDLALHQLADVAGLSASHFKVLFADR
jgi:AraC family transcriptional regulator